MLARFLTCLATIFAATCAAFGQSSQIQPNSTWMNQRQSVLTIAKINSNGTFNGTYVNNDANYKCVGKPYAVTGLIDGNEIVFQVHCVRPGWPNCNAISSWTGYWESGKIVTQWELLYESSPGKYATAQGSDTFTLQ